MNKIIIHIIPSISICFILQIILHEIGHFIGGFLTGWKLIYIQVYKFVLKRSNKSLNLITVDDIGFKCIMYPKSIYTDAILYTVSGYIINLFTGILGLIFMIKLSLSPVLWLYTWCFSVFGIGMYLINGKASIKRVCNDKACYNLLKADTYTRFCHNTQLMIAKQLEKGLTYRQIGEEIICICPEIAENDIQAYHSVLEYYYYLDINNYTMMAKAIDKIKETNNISKEVLNIIEMERIYIWLHSSLNDNHSINSSINYDYIKKYIEKNLKNIDVHYLRIKAVFEAYIYYYEENKANALSILNKEIKRMKQAKYIYKGEKIFCINQLIYIKNMIEKDMKNYRKDIVSTT